MGHLINPISFRLGYSRNWGFAGALMESKSQYFYLNGNHYNLLVFFKRIFSLQTFEKMGIIFSHLKFLSSYKKDIVILYLYDGPLQNESFIFYKYFNRFKKVVKILKYGKKFFKQFLQQIFFSFYYLGMLENILNQLNSLILNFINLKLKVLMLLLALLKSNLKILDNIYFLKSSLNIKIKNNIVMNYLFLNNVNMFFFNCLFFDFNVNFFFFQQSLKNHMFNFELIYFFLSICKIINFFLYYYKKCNIFFFVKCYNILFSSKNKNFQHLLTGYSNIFYNNNNIFLKNIYNEFFHELVYIKNLFKKYQIFQYYNGILKNFLLFFLNGFFQQRINFYNFCKKLLYSINKGQKKKFIFFNFFFKFFSYLSTNFFIFFKNLISIFKPFFLNINSKNFLLYFKNISKKEVTSALITKYICIRLKQRFSLKEVIKPILKDLTANPLIQGFRLSCCGRFTKKEIATYKWERRGRISLNTIDARIDYSFNYIILKYSVCGIKVWLHKNSTYKYFFRKWFENFRYFSKRKKIRKYNFKNKNFAKTIKRSKKKINKKMKYLFRKRKLGNKKIQPLFKFYKIVKDIRLRKSLKPFLLNFKK